MIPFSGAAFTAASEGMRSAALTVVPSLFPLLVFSHYLLSSKIIMSAVQKNRIVSSVIMPLFCALCGIPSSAILINGLYSYGAYEQKPSSFLCALYTMPGPMFLISAVSNEFIQNKFFAPYLLLACYVPPLTASVIYAFFSKKCFRQPVKSIQGGSVPNGSGLVNAISEASSAMLRICGTIIFFSVIFGVADSAGIFKPIPNRLSGIVKGTIEMTNGIMALSSDSTRVSAASVAFILSFGGISVYVQSKMIFGELSSGLYLITKLAAGIVSAVIMWSVYPIIPMPIETISGLSERLAVNDTIIERRMFYLLTALVPFVLTIILSLFTTKLLRKEKGR